VKRISAWQVVFLALLISAPMNGADAVGVKAIDAVENLVVKGRAPKTGYARSEFGSPWVDVDKNGCDTRNDILRRDLTQVVFKLGKKECEVLSGVLTDKYSGETINFVKGKSTSSLVQIDHVVSLSDAWQKGAFLLTLKERTAFANDPLNLIAVKASLNSQKGDGDAATWLPPQKSYRCEYISRQIAVKKKYHLWVTAAERSAFVRVLQTCPNQELVMN
jgi:hypothetical protein